MNKIVQKLILVGFGLRYPIYVIGSKIIISKAIYEDWKFSIEGLNLYKAEREIFGGNKFEFSGILNIRIGRIILTYNRKGFMNHCRHMTIINPGRKKDQVIAYPNEY